MLKLSITSLLLLLALSATGAVAQPVEDASSPFGTPALGAPSRDETGPLGKPASVSLKPDLTTDTTTEGPQGPSTTDAPTNATTPGAPAVASQTQSYVDGLMAGLITAGELPGATVVVIQNGQVVLKSGYGYADLEARIPVDPDQTRFRVASISKLITATAAMQMVEQGKVDLNADINTYLTAFKVPSNYPEPVTLANLLTHTAGFDDKYVGMAAPLATPVKPLAQYLARALPQRVLPPNQVIAYSNHGMALAGHVVENVSGQEFNAYVQEHIFTPLGMSTSSFGVPYPMPPTMAVPYFKGGEDTGFKRSELDSSRMGPAGDLITTGADMASFMLAHLNNGQYGDGEHVLSELSIERMHTEHFVNAKDLNGWAYGFETGQRNGVRWIGHDGSWRGFCAQLVLNPETKSGFFVAYNVDCHFSVSAPLRKALFDLLWPSKEVVVAQGDASAETRARSAVGYYMSVRRARADFTVMAAAASQIHVTAPGAGQLKIFFPSIGHALTFLPQVNGNWKNPDLQWNAAIKADQQGKVTSLFIDASAFDRVLTTSQWAVWSVALGFVVAICVMTIWGWANGFLSRHFFGEPQAVITFAPRVTGFLAAGMTLASLISMLALLSDGAPDAVLQGPTPMLMVLLSVPVAIGLISIPMVVWSISGFGSGPRARMAQVGYMVLTLAILTYVAFAWQWGLHPLGVLAN
jgi:CubicO group peptidase (beta-lactamase class C family)